MEFLNVENSRLCFVDSLGDSYYCPMRRVGLMKCHNAAKIFGNESVAFYFSKWRVSCYRSNGHTRPYPIKPFFHHPHDLWAAKRGDNGLFKGKIVQASFDGKQGFSGWTEAPKHLLIELEENVFAFAETTLPLQCYELVGKEVTFYFYKYNSKTKKIYGHI